MPKDKKQAVWKKANGLCAHCGKQIIPSKQTIDHVIPQSIGGTDDFRNLMPLCKMCNGSRESKKVNIAEYYKYASPFAISDAESYVMDWRLLHRNSAGGMYLF